MEKIFNLLTCNDVDKVILAEYQLEGKAEHWWRASKDIIFPAGTERTWKVLLWHSMGSIILTVHGIRKKISLCN